MVELHDHMVVTLTDVFAPILPRKFSGSSMPVDAGAYLLALEEKVKTDIDPVLQRMKVQISDEWKPLILPTGDGYQALVRANHRWIEEEWLEKFRTGMASLAFQEFDLLGSRHIAHRKYLLENSKQVNTDQTTDRNDSDNLQFSTTLSPSFWTRRIMRYRESLIHF